MRDQLLNSLGADVVEFDDEDALASGSFVPDAEAFFVKLTEVGPTLVGEPTAAVLSTEAYDLAESYVLEPEPEFLSISGLPDGDSSARTTSDGVELAQILRDHPDVYQAFFTEYYGEGNDRHSSAWADRVGGTTPEDYANYWYKTYGGPQAIAASAAADPAKADHIDLDQLLRDRPDVFAASFTEFYGAHNDRHSSAWMDRVGGSTPQDYASYWYKMYGRGEGYNQAPPASAPAPTEPGEPVDSVVLGSSDPEVPAALADDGAGAATDASAMTDSGSSDASSMLSVGQRFSEPDLFIIA